MMKLFHSIRSGFIKAFIIPFAILLFMPISSIYSEQFQSEYRDSRIIIAKGRLFIGMTKKEAFDVEGVPYRVRRLADQDNKEMWIYRCNNEEGFDEDCLYLYFDGDELEKIERP